MPFWLHRNLGWAVLAMTLLSLAGPPSSACACPRDMTTEGQVVAGSKQGCPRCQPAAATVGSSASAHVAQLSRASCCKSRVSDARSATTPAKIELERHETRAMAPAAVTPAPAYRGSVRSTRAPPSRGARDSASPPASYLSDYLRL